MSLATRVARWPRETRDTLFLLALIGWTIAPHLWRQPPWLALLCAGALLWRGRLAITGGALPGRWTLVALLLLVSALVWQGQRTLLGREAGVLMLVAMMSLKTLELRARRDAMVLFFLGFFLVLTHFLFSQSLATAVAMGLTVWGWLTALTLAHMPAGRPPLSQAARLAGRAALLGAPLMVVLFLFFPRLPPLWAMPGDSGRTGLSDRLSLGDVAELALDDSIALRLRFEGAAPAARDLYLRGPVLSRYDGREWRAQVSPAVAEDRAWPPVSGRGLPYEMTLEPTRTAWLPLLDATPRAPQGLPGPLAAALVQDRAGQWRLPAPLAERVRLQGRAWLGAAREPQLPAATRRETLSLPPHLHPATRAWAQALRDRLPEATTPELAQAVLGHIRGGAYRYTLAPGPYLGDPVDEFWLERQAGFCEHYAAAFVVIMRSLGVPARIVTGYQGSDGLPVDGYLVVRQSQAHAWAEVWVEGLGWQRVDPTAAVAPERIERGRPLRAPGGLVGGALDAVDPALRDTLRAWAEALDNRWNQWVLSYGSREQLGLLSRLGWHEPDLQQLGQALALVLGAAALAGAAWAAWEARRRTPWQRLQRGLLRQLAALDLPASRQDDPGQLARRLCERHGAAAGPAADALLELQRWRYGPASNGTAAPPGWSGRFRRACRGLRRPPR